jgi:hypothetical protein
MGAVEAAAKKAWQTGIDVREKYDLAGAKKLLAALDGFEKAHGGTDFAGGKKAEIARLRGLADAAIEASPEGLLAKVSKLFRGKVTGFDSKTGRIAILYDFEDPAQVKDWDLSSFAAGKLSGTDVKVQGGRLHMVTTGRCALLKGLFRSEMSISAEFQVHGGQGDCTVIVCADDRGNYYNLFGLQEGKQSYMERYAKGKWHALTKSRPSPFSSAKRGTLLLGFKNGLLSGKVGGVPFSAKDSTYPFGRVGFWTFNTHSSYDNVRVTGLLDRDWLEGALARLAARSKPAASYAARWTKLKFAGKTPPGRVRATQALTYDSKRKRVVLFGGSRYCDMWALDLSRMAWTCLQQNDYGAKSGAPKPRRQHFHSMVYDSGGDQYWLMDSEHCWAFNPNTEAWKDHGLPEGLPNWRSGNVRSGWVYDPDGKRIMRVHQGRRGIFFYYPAGGKVERMPSPANSGMSYIDGGVAYDRKNKLFVVTGGTPVSQPSVETWAFDPRVKTWRKLRTEQAPPNRPYHNLHWHEKLGVVVFAGGSIRKGTKNDGWVLETAADRWVKANTPTPGPSVEGGTTYDEARGVVVYFDRGGGTWTLRLTRQERR